jgi:uncharacterized repeat protein (TIGR01451 family)
MFKGLRIFGASAVFALAFGAQAFAQAKPGNCIDLKTTAEVEKDVVNAQGEKSKSLVPAGTVIPGTEVVLTVTANNTCKQPSDKVVISNPVPEHMTLVPGSAIGAGSDITFSVDGKTFAPAGKVTITENGATRPARAEEYRHVRWEFKNSLQPGASAMGRFRATLD